MSPEQMTDPNKPKHGDLFANLFWPIIASVIASILALVIEYKSGFFQQSSDASGGSSEAISGSRYLVLNSLLTFLILLFLFRSFKIRILKKRYLRESFALNAGFVCLFMAAEILLVFASGFLPWQSVVALVFSFLGKPVTPQFLKWNDYALLITMCLLVFLLFRDQHEKWSGLISTRQAQAEKNGDQSNFIEDFWFELCRISRRKSPLVVFSPKDRALYPIQLDLVADTLVWKDCAMELIRISCQSYEFDPENSWHDREQCWVGNVSSTQELVFLFPVGSNSEISEEILNGFVSYCDKTCAKQRRDRGEIVVIAKFADTDISTMMLKQKSIRFESEDSLLDKLVSLSDYKSEIRRRVDREKLPDSAVSLFDVYVPSSAKVRSSDSEKTIDNVEEYLLKWLDEKSQRQLALLGEYGQGKSSTALMLTYRLLHDRKSNRIPILIELRGMSPRNLTPLALLGAWAAKYRINPEALMRLLIAGRLLIIFEGFDEVALVGDEDMRLKHFKALWRFCYPNSKILITGRPNFFLDETELKLALGIARPSATRPYCDEIRLLPLSHERLALILGKYKQSISSQIIALAQKKRTFFELVSRPSLLHIVVVLWEKEGLAKRVELLHSAYVMDLFMRHSYRRQGLKESDVPDFMALTSDEREYFMTGIAAYMVVHEMPNQISAFNLNELIEDLVKRAPDSISRHPSSITGEISIPLRERIAKSEYGLEHVKTDVRTCGLLVDDPASVGTFKFAHKAFMEYLYASLMFDKTRESVEDSTRAIIEITEANIKKIVNLPASIDFIAEMVVSNHVSSTQSNKLHRVEVATKLLRALVFERSTFAFVTITISLFLLALKDSGKHLSLPGRLFILIWQPDVAMNISYVAMLIFKYLFHAQTNIIFYFIIMFQMMALLNLSVGRESGRALWIWSYICKKIGIDDDSLRCAAGGRIFWWAKGQPFAPFEHYGPLGVQLVRTIANQSGLGSDRPEKS